LWYAAQLGADSFLTLARIGAPKAERVLVVRLDAIGDMVLWLDAGRALSEHYRSRGQRIYLVANSAWAAWIQEMGIFDEVIALDRNKYEKDLAYRCRLGLRIRKLRTSLAIQPTYSREWLLGDSVMRISGAPKRIGSSGNSNTQRLQRRIADYWYTDLIPCEPGDCMELVRNAEFVRGAVGLNYKAAVPDLRAAAASWREPIELTAILSDRKYYVFFPGASWEGRQWPAENFVEVANRLYHETGWLGVLCGGPGDQPVASRIVSSSNSALVNLAGRTTLSELTAVIRNAQLLLTNETSAVHIGAALGRPTVCILGGGHYGRFMPYSVVERGDRPLPTAVTHIMPCFGCNWQCKYPVPKGDAVPCIQQITVPDVWKMILAVLSPAQSSISW
jgi:ADP-heptose:LPS heptosyltransferase